MFSNLSAMTGIPEGKKRPVRRGGGRHKGKPPVAADHHENLNAAMKSGDHAAAKSSALMLAKALHAMQAKTQAAGMQGATATNPSQPVDSV